MVANIDVHLKEIIHNSIDIPVSITSKTKLFKKIYNHCDDVKFQNITCEAQRYLLLSVGGLTDVEKLEQDVIKPIKQLHSGCTNLKSLEACFTYISNTKMLTQVLEVIEELAIGNAVIFNNVEKRALSFSVSTFDKRAIEEPQAESVIHGPREGFIESNETNISLVRKRIKTPSLKMETIKVGTYSQTAISISYIEGIVNQVVVEEVRKRLNRMDVDAILSSSAVEEGIEDSWISIFPQVQSTERPDVTSAALLEGRVAIFVDGSPFILIVPVTLFTILQSPDDYNERFFNGTFVRWIRYFSIIVALVAPSIYIAVLTFHQEMIPTTLLLRVAQSREEIPFPAFFEAFLMEIVFEVLREAGLRLPKQMGSTVSVVGTLVIGQAAIQAGLVSAPMVMIVAITGISSFMIPQYSAGIAIRWLRFPIMFLASGLGLLGMMLGIILLVSHLCILRSFGVPYLAPLAPLYPTSLTDVLIRVPNKFMKKRPPFYAFGNLIRRNEDPSNENQE